MTESARAGPPDDVDGAFSVTRLVLLLGLLMCVSFPGIVFGLEAFVYRDAGTLSYPVAYYFRHCFWQGQFPFWNPYNNCGIPFMAEWHTMVLYPFSLFYLLLPLPWSLNYFQLGHVFLGGIGMYFLAWRWFGNRFAATLAGLVFAWNGFGVENLLWPSNTAALGWMPWVVLLCEKAVAQGGRAVFVAALAGACQMLSGSPEMILFTWFIVVPVCAAQGFTLKIGLRFAAVVGLIAALSAAQLAPWIDFVAHGDRSSAFGDARWSLPAWGAANFLVPLFRDNASVEGVFWQPGQELFASYYAGIVTVALMLVALMKARNRKTLLLASLALGGLLCACGDAGHVLPLLKKIAPVLGFSRYPVKFIVITIFCLPLLAAAGAAWLLSQADAAGRRPLLAAGAITGLAIAGVLLVSRQFPFPGEQWNMTSQSGWTRLAFLFVALVVLLQRSSIRRLSGFALLLLVGADLCTHAPRQIPPASVQAYDNLSPPMTTLPKLGQSRALLSRDADAAMNHLANPSALGLYLSHRTELFGDCNLPELIPKVDGVFALNLREEARVAQLFSGPEYPFHLAEFLGVSQLASAKKLFTWDAQTNYMPMATIGQKPVFLDDAAALRALASAEFRPREVVILPTETRDSVSATAEPAAKILASKVTASDCEFTTETSRPTMLVVAQSWYHCWTAEIDGRAAPLLRANYGFQSVAVPAGRHEVRLAYKDTLFCVGAAVSLVSLSLCVMGLMGRRG